MKHSVKRVAAIHDLSGFGRASLTAIIPILSSMGVQVCPLPTANLSNQDRKSTRLNSSHTQNSRMPSSA